MFASIARRYDTANEVLSLGIHKGWRRAAVAISGPLQASAWSTARPGPGTWRWSSKRAVGPAGEVIGTDFCAEMLEPAPAKAARAGLDVKFAVADALALPYPMRGSTSPRSPSGSATWTIPCDVCGRWRGW